MQWIEVVGEWVYLPKKSRSARISLVLNIIIRRVLPEIIGYQLTSSQQVFLHI